MEQKTREQLELNLRDCLDRAEACDADSEDYFKFLKEANAIGATLNAEDQIRNEAEIEREKIEAQSKMHLKDWLTVLAVPVAGLVTMGIKIIFQSKQTDKIMKFEETNTWASSGGRAVTGSIRDEFKL